MDVTVCHLLAFYLFLCACRLAGDQRARRDTRHDSDAEDDDDVKKVRIKSLSCLKSVGSALHMCRVCGFWFDIIEFIS